MSSDKREADEHLRMATLTMYENQARYHQAFIEELKQTRRALEDEIDQQRERKRQWAWVVVRFLNVNPTTLVTEAIGVFDTEREADIAMTRYPHSKAKYTLRRIEVGKTWNFESDAD